MKKILLTGGAGYIGSHTAITLLEAGHEVVVIDNLVNANEESIKRVEKITGKSIRFYCGDVCDRATLDTIFDEQSIDAVVHFAGLKAVGESVEQPLRYYRNNLDSTLTLLEAMAAHHVKKFVFSSSATVYGSAEQLPLTEESPTGVGITNPYGWTKYMIEQILQGAVIADPTLEVTILRYFNPIGAHPSGEIGEDPHGIPNNLMPYIAQVAVGRRPHLTINGTDYNTPDGSCIRDYIHVVDLANGHLAALTHLTPGCEVYNLGTGNGVSVLQAVAAFEVSCGVSIPYVVGPRRAGDVVSCYADANKANHDLNWHAERSFQTACDDTWRWQSQNPNGYAS